MEVKNCRQCGRLFNYLGGGTILCQGCKEKLEDVFQTVKEFVRTNPNASIQEVADAGETTTSQIKQWVREERLEFSKESDVGLDCEMCGKMIKSGRFCDDCKIKMRTGFADATKKPEPIEKPKPRANTNKMRFIK